ncbi:MAG: AAA family ATPase, partial [Gemmatimonadaceae bacterium]|nr:AAA family ATPase [Gemmatimonadaceae bacterium]
AAETEPLPDVPDWLLLLMQGAYRGAEAPQEIPEDVPPGGRNNALTRYGGTLRAKGMGEALIFKLLMAINEEWSQPLDRTEVAIIAASVCRYEPQGEAFIVSSKPKREKPLPLPYSIADLQHEELPPIRWAVQGLFAEGMGIIGGKAKIGKSWLALDVAIAVAEGSICFGSIPVDDGDVLYLALEDNKRRLQRRMKDRMGEGEAWPPRLFVATEWPNQEQGGVLAIDAWLGEHPQARLVIIDTFARFRPQVEAKKSAGVYADDYAATEALHGLASRHGICVLVLTHLNKAMHEDWTDQITGSTGLTGGVDSIVGLFRKRGEKQGELKLCLRDGDDCELAMDFSGHGWTILGDAEEFALGQESQTVVTILRAHNGPMTVAEIAPLINKTNPTTYRLLHRLAQRGVVKSMGAKFYGLPDEGGV